MNIEGRLSNNHVIVASPVRMYLSKIEGSLSYNHSSCFRHAPGTTSRPEASQSSFTRAFTDNRPYWPLQGTAAIITAVRIPSEDVIIEN